MPPMPLIPMQLPTAQLLTDGKQHVGSALAPRSIHVQGKNGDEEQIFTSLTVRAF